MKELPARIKNLGLKFPILRRLIKPAQPEPLNALNDLSYEQAIRLAGQLGGLNFIPQDIHLQAVPENSSLKELSQGYPVSDINEGKILKQLARKHLQQNPQLITASDELGLDIVVHRTKSRERWLRFGMGLGLIGTIAIGVTAAVVIHQHRDKDKKP